MADRIGRRRRNGDDGVAVRLRGSSIGRGRSGGDRGREVPRDRDRFDEPEPRREVRLIEDPARERRSGGPQVVAVRGVGYRIVAEDESRG